MRTGNIRILWRPEVTPYASHRKWRAPFFRSLNHVQGHSIHATVGDLWTELTVTSNSWMKIKRQFTKVRGYLNKIKCINVFHLVGCSRRVRVNEFEGRVFLYNDQLRVSCTIFITVLSKCIYEKYSSYFKVS